MVLFCPLCYSGALPHLTVTASCLKRLCPLPVKMGILLKKHAFVWRLLLPPQPYPGPGLGQAHIRCLFSLFPCESLGGSQLSSRSQSVSDGGTEAGSGAAGGKPVVSRCSARHLISVISATSPNSSSRWDIIPTLQIRKLRLREMTYVGPEAVKADPRI